MSGPKRILVACGTAIATSTVIAKSIEEAMAARGIDVVTTQCKIAEVAEMARQGYDLVVSTGALSIAVPIPSIDGLALLTGVGKERVLDRIAVALTQDAA